MVNTVSHCQAPAGQYHMAQRPETALQALVNILSFLRAVAL